MIFDDPIQPPSDREVSTSSSKRRSSRSSRGGKAGQSTTRRRRRNSSESTFARATHLEPPADSVMDRGSMAWLWVLGLLVLVTIAFTWFLAQERGSPRTLSGEAPSSLLLPYFDPSLAPLETGSSGYRSQSVAELGRLFQSEREGVNLDDQEIYRTAETIADFLEEALEDRYRHLERLLRLGTRVAGMPFDPAAPTTFSGIERRHHEAAVGVSWQRNSLNYRNSIENLWSKLLRLEKNRFVAGSAPHSMVGDAASQVPAAP